MRSTGWWSGRLLRDLKEMRMSHVALWKSISSGPDCAKARGGGWGEDLACSRTRKEVSVIGGR